MFSVSSFTTPSPSVVGPNRLSLSPPSLSTAIQHFQSVQKLASLIDKSNSLNHLLQIHASLFRHGLHDHSILNFKLLRSFSNLGCLNYSVAIFERSLDPNVFFWTAIIHAHAQCSLFDQALLYYLRMLTHGIEPNCYTFSAVLKARSLRHGISLHSQAIKYGFDSDLFVRTALIDVYARCGDVISARQLFDNMPNRSVVSLTAMINCYAKIGELKKARALFGEMEERDVVCWNVMIDGYAQHGLPTEALSLFRKMLMAEVKPNEVTVLAALSACAQLGALESGRWLHSYIQNKKIKINVHVGSALIDMYSKCGSLEDARQVFNKITERDIVVWNAMIMAYAIHGQGQDGLKLFSQMGRIGYRPTDITFIGLLSACSNGGLVEEGRNLFNMMKYECGIQPKIEHYGCMVNLLGRAGHLEEAYELVKNMKFEADPILWGTLLWSCKIHGNIRLGEEIAEFLVSQNLANSGTYVLLSNIYAQVGDWEGVARIRTLMKDKKVEKEPGCSTVEINNKIHEFLAGDKKHPKGKEIYRMLEEINGWLRARGHAPQTGVVLHDLGEKQKEESLQVHSEKLAIAFGLISSARGASIKIVKNLRVCSDCHNVMKLISEITGRRIVMRDRNRFHHFAVGSCSCGDFW